MFSIFVLRASAQIEALPKAGHARRRSGARDLWEMTYLRRGRLASYLHCWFWKHVLPTD